MINNICHSVINGQLHSLEDVKGEKRTMALETRKCVYETLCPQLVSHFQDVKMSTKMTKFKL